MPRGLEQMGVEAIIKNLPKYLKGMDKMGTSTQKTQGIIGKIGGIAKSAVGGIATIGLAAGAAAIGGVAALGGALFKLASDAAPIAGIKQTFEELTASMEGGSKAVLAALQEQSAGMVTNTDLMKSYNLASLLIGESFTKQLPDAMGYVGKVALATGEDMGFLMDSLVRGVGRLSPMILDNLGITVNLTEAYEDWAKANGVAVSEMTKADQQAAVMEQTMSKLAEKTADMPEVAGSAQQAFASFGVQMKNVKDEIGLALLPVVVPLMTKLGELAKEVLPLVVEWVSNKLVPALQTVFAWLGEHVPAAIEKAKNFWTNVLQPALSAVGDFINTKIVPIIQTVVGWLQEHLPGATSTATNFFTEHLLPALKAIWGFIETKLLPLIEALAEVVVAVLGKAFEILAGLWENILWPALKDLWEFLKEKLGPVFNSIGDAISKVTDWLKDLAKKIREIKLPDWLQRSSPSPFEMTFIGAGDAIKKLTQMELPRLQAQLQTTAAAPAVAGSMSNTANFNITQNIRDRTDAAIIADRIERDVMDRLSRV